MEVGTKNHKRIEFLVCQDSLPISTIVEFIGSLCGSLRLGVCQRKWPQSECGEVWRYENGEIGMGRGYVKGAYNAIKAVNTGKAFLTFLARFPLCLLR